MTAKKCDRCGAYYDKTDVRPEINIVQFKNGFTTNFIDLCEECQRKLESFLKGE